MPEKTGMASRVQQPNVFLFGVVHLHIHRRTASYVEQTEAHSILKDLNIIKFAPPKGWLKPYKWCFPKIGVPPNDPFL